MSDLANSNFLVTGGGGGIGGAIAGVLKDAGAKVAITDVDEAGLTSVAQETGADLTATADVRDEGSVIGLFDKTLDAFGSLHGLIHCAGMVEVVGPTEGQVLEDWRKVVDVNLQGTYLMAREAARRLEDGGSIVNIASVAGQDAFTASNSYSVTKAAVIMLTKTLATDLARRKIRVNAVSPGLVETRMLEQVTQGNADVTAVLLSRVPWGEFGKPLDVAYAVEFLVSDKARYITGVTLPVDGGWTAFGNPGPASTPQA